MKFKSPPRIGLLPGKQSILLIIAATAVASLSWKPVTKQALIEPLPSEISITMCGGFVATAAYMEAPVKLLKGLGDLHYTVNTKEPLAQKYFDQGLRLIYAFNHVEALRAFREASRLDPQCAMTFWGQALALGPNINDWNPTDRESMAMEAISTARKLSASTTTKEADFINALATRYDGNVHDNRDTLNAAYVEAMESLAKKYPEDPEALVLYADAVMNSMPWDYWNGDGTPKAGTVKARAALESAIKQFPRHPGAHHLYIHLVEASNRPGDALNSAAFLNDAMPNAGHMVHMPSHIYVRVGDYERANMSNAMAVKVDEAFLAESEDQGYYRVAYYPHNIDFLVYGSLMNGQYAQAYRDAAKLAYHMNAIENAMPVYYDFFMSSPIIAHVRFGAWNEVLALPQPDGRYFHLSATHHFARGLAFLRKEMLHEAEYELHKLDSINRLDTLKTIYAFFNSAHQVSNVATNLLKGEVLIKQKKLHEGIDALKRSVEVEDSLRYNEPPDWRLPARHFLGAALLDAGQFGEAEKVFESDLARNPENGWALQGLLQSQKNLGKKKEAALTEQRFRKAWRRADVQIRTSRF